MVQVRFKSVLVLVLFLYGMVAQAGDEETWQKEIDEQVWKVFIEAYESADIDAYNALYTEDVLRVTPAGIDTEGRFKEENKQHFKNRKADNAVSTLDFWFEHRQTNHDTSYEVGFFDISYTHDSGEEDHFLGQFHIVLKKIDGVWKITQDWDSDFVRNAKVSADDFSLKTPVEFD